ncbi:hypothetical protein M011DRAFT_410320 [Sporormia fimetaria CBS 119925]|uniref:Integral membrane protein n=1 Tax=Sporormia fimetaria CBS 119925 TaxID=1340428 RepID=A0A6A6V2L2_9PLEO|nr:hypothetical protein M011DRAFT_410320 [Sporormia fimetaria CBS 119925]
MYSKKSWGGSIEPYIMVKFIDAGKKQPVKVEDPVVAVVIWEWKDTDLLGKPADRPFDEREWICNDDNIDRKVCDAKHKGEYILQDDAETKSKNYIRTAAFHLNAKEAINYPVASANQQKTPLKTGYYCVATEPLVKGVEYEAVVTFQNAYGELPAAQIAKLPFYGGITILYALIGIFWGFLYAQHRHDILPVQNYITAIIVFLVLEMLMTWGFYDYQNRHGNNTGAKALMIIVAILNAFRNSFSFFLLLIVCMGYGVVKPSLGKTMWIVRYLAVGHFVFGVIYAIASLTVRPDDAGPLVLLVILPLSATLTAFYIWTLNSLNLTMKDLIARKQHVKANMYKKLWWCILTSIIVIFGFFFINSFTFAGTSSPDFAPTHWQTRWFVLDGWLNIVYLADVCFIAYMWRPTANNRRFAMSDEIAQDDDGFEIASLRDSLDSEEGRGDHPPAYDPAPRHQSPPGVHFDRNASPLPAPRAQKPVVPPRESLDGETIFAVGEDDKWSDDESELASPNNGGESARLTTRKND